MGIGDFMAELGFDGSADGPTKPRMGWSILQFHGHILGCGLLRNGYQKMNKLSFIAMEAPEGNQGKVHRVIYFWQ